MAHTVASWDYLALAAAVGKVGAGAIWQKLSNAIIDLEVDGSEFTAHAESPEQLAAYCQAELKVTLRPGQVATVMRALSGGTATQPQRDATADAPALAVEAPSVVAASAATPAASDADAAAPSPAGLQETHPTPVPVALDSPTTVEVHHNTAASTIAAAPAPAPIHASDAHHHKPIISIGCFQHHSQATAEAAAPSNTHHSVDAPAPATSPSPSLSTATPAASSTAAAGTTASAAFPTLTVQDVLNKLRARSVAFCDEYPRDREKLVQMPGLFMADGSLPFCFGCKSRFSLFTWRHHCRACGLIFCRKCSGAKLRLPPAFQHGSRPVRVCDLCAAFGAVRGSGCGDMDDASLLSPALLHRTITALTLVDNSAVAQDRRARVRAACEFFGLDPDAPPARLTRQAVKKAYMHRLRDAHPDTAPAAAAAASETQDAMPGLEAAATAAMLYDDGRGEPSIAQVKAHHDVLMEEVQRLASSSSSNDESGDGGGGGSAAGAAGAAGAGSGADALRGQNGATRMITSDAVCSECLRAFNSKFQLRRHHCRRCGQAVCAECSPDLRPLPECVPLARGRCRCRLDNQSS
jgi:hypothetical protein